MQSPEMQTKRYLIIFYFFTYAPRAFSSIAGSYSLRRLSYSLLSSSNGRIAKISYKRQYKCKAQYCVIGASFNTLPTMTCHKANIAAKIGCLLRRSLNESTSYPVGAYPGSEKKERPRGESTPSNSSICGRKSGYWATLRSKSLIWAL